MWFAAVGLECLLELVECGAGQADDLAAFVDYMDLREREGVDNDNVTDWSMVSASAMAVSGGTLAFAIESLNILSIDSQY